MYSSPAHNRVNDTCTCVRANTTSGRISSSIVSLYSMRLNILDWQTYEKSTSMPSLSVRYENRSHVRYQITGSGGGGVVYVDEQCTDTGSESLTNPVNLLPFFTHQSKELWRIPQANVDNRYYLLCRSQITYQYMYKGRCISKQETKFRRRFQQKNIGVVFAMLSIKTEGFVYHQHFF